MKIFGKHIFRSIKANPGQPTLITVIVALCVTVMILSIALPINIYKNEQASLLADEYSADLEISLRADSGHRLVFTDEISEAIGERGRVIGEFALTGFLTQEGQSERLQVKVGAFDLEQVDAFYSLRYVQLGKITNANLKKVAIVAEGFAAERGLSLGDSFAINVLGERYTYTVVGIAKEVGIMRRESILVDVSSIREALNKKSSLIALLPTDFSPFTVAHVKLYDGVDASEIKSELEGLESFRDKKISLPSDSAKADYMSTLLTVTIVTPAMLLIVVAVMMTVSTFDLLSKKRVDDLALFKAAGADDSHLHKLLYLESMLYALFGGVIGTVISVPLMNVLNELYGFKYSRITFGITDLATGVGFALLFTFFSTNLHLVRQKKKSLDEALRSSDFSTDTGLRHKILTFGISLCALAIFTAVLPVRVRFLGAFLWLFATVAFIYVMAPYLIGAVSWLTSYALSKLRRGAGVFVIAAKSCLNSYPLRHAGRITTVLITVFMSFSFILSAVEGQLTSYFDLPSFDYVGVMADDVTRDRVSKMDGVIATAEASMAANVMFDSGKTATGISAKGDVDICFKDDLLPESMPVGNSVVLSRGLVRMLGIDVGDSVKLTVGGVPCELVLVGVVDTVGDFVFYDAGYVGSGYNMLCIRTDGGADTQERLAALFDERGAECLTTEEFFDGAHKRVESQTVLFRAMLIVMILLTAIGVLNVLAEERIARKREIEIMKQNGMTDGGAVCMHLVEILYLITFGTMFGILFSHILCYIVDVATISFGMTIYG